MMHCSLRVLKRPSMYCNHHQRLQTSVATNATTKPVAVISGASTGIGHATALLLADNGWTVYAGVRKAEDGERLVSQNPALCPVILDVTKPETMLAARQKIEQETDGNGVQAVINNAGKGVLIPFEHMSDETLRDIMEVNLIGAVKLTQIFLPLVRAGKQKGRIVMIGSLAGTIALPMFGAYSLTKFGLEAACDMLRSELQQEGIKVILIKPGPVKTPIWDKTASDGDVAWSAVPPEGKERYVETYTAMCNLADESARTGVDVSVVAGTILESLTVPNPKARYPLPSASAFAMTVRRIVPDSWWDWLMGRVLGRIRGTPEQRLERLKMTTPSTTDRAASKTKQAVPASNDGPR